MPVRKAIPGDSGTFFITFTCYRWLHLLEKSDSYAVVYAWFDHLKSKGHFINGFVIMPNHVHALISFISTGQSINSIVGNGKRFMAYQIVEMLQQKNEMALLKILSANIESRRKENKKVHNAWELSFDWKECLNRRFTWQKLDYIHNNPCTGKWQLSSSPVEYLHSSARFYLTGEQGLYPVKNFMEMLDVDFGNTAL